MIRLMFTVYPFSLPFFNPMPPDCNESNVRCPLVQARTGRSGAQGGFVSSSAPAQSDPKSNVLKKSYVAQTITVNALTNLCQPAKLLACEKHTAHSGGTPIE
jgi:hypothetical protein